MSCNDICAVMEYDGRNEFYSEATRRAAKEHRCCECGSTIARGEQYECASGKSNGDLWTNRTCAVCAEIRKAFCCDTWIFGELWEAIGDQVFPEWNEMTAIDCLAKLTTDDAIAEMRSRYAQYVEDRS